SWAASRCRRAAGRASLRPARRSMPAPGTIRRTSSCFLRNAPNPGSKNPDRFQTDEDASASPSEERPRHRNSAGQRVDAAALARVEFLPFWGWRHRGRRRNATVLSGIELLTIGASGLVALVAALWASWIIPLVTLVAALRASWIIPLVTLVALV